MEKNTKLADFPKEDRKGSMVGLKRVLWRPNNYRRGLRIKGLGGLNIKSCIRKLTQSFSFPVEYSFSPSNKLYFFTVSPNVKIMVGPSKVIGIWSQSKVGGVKETFLLSSDSEDGLEGRIDEIRKRISAELDVSCSMVLRSLGGVSGVGDPFWVRHEDWIKGEDFIDSLPREVIIHDTVFKKVYGEGVEFVGGKGVEAGVRVKNYIKNRALEDFSPEIGGALNAMAVSLKEFVDGFSPVLVEFAGDVKVHNRVLKDISKAFTKFNRLLGDRQKRLKDFF